MNLFGVQIQTLLTVKYLQPSYMFTDKEHRGPFAFSEELGNLSIGAESAENIVSAQRIEANDKDLLLSTSEKEESKGPSNNGSAYNAPTYDASQAQADLVSFEKTLTADSKQSSLSIEDLLGLGLTDSSSTAPSPPPLKLNAKNVLDPNIFQQKWRQLPISVSQVCF